jgi:hypothetical protein
MKPPNCSHAVLRAPVTGRDSRTLSGGATVAGAVGGAGGTGVRLAIDVEVPGSSVVVVVDDVVLDDEDVVGASVVDVVVVDVVLVDDDVVGASVVDVLLDDEVVGASVVDVVVDVVLVEDVLVEEDVVGASVVDVVLVVLVVELSNPQPQVCERLNFGLPPPGVITADELVARRSVRSDPLGTATNTLSCWTPFLMIAAPLTV